MQWQCGVTTAPRGELYLDRTIASLHGAGWDRVIISDDAESTGAIYNFRDTLRVLCRDEPDMICICQDDVIFARNCRQFVEQAWGTLANIGCFSLYCSSCHRANGFKRIVSNNITGACALVFDLETATQLCKSPILCSPRSTRKVDMQIAIALKQSGKAVWTYAPSLAQHIGDVSSLPGHGRAAGHRAARDFIGEDADATEQLTCV